MRLIWILVAKKRCLAKRGLLYQTAPVVRENVHVWIYITKGLPCGRFSETFGMSEARSSRILGATDFSIARILSIGDRVENVTAETETFDSTTNFQQVDYEQVVGQDARRKRRRLPTELATEHDYHNQDTNEESASRQRREEREEHVGNRVVLSEETCSDSSDATSQRNNNHVQRTDLTWLQYTRYRPPKLPRRSFIEKRRKRRAGDHPRIPFSSAQLQMLEDRYRRGAYLSRNDVVEISAMLRLPQSKVRKI